ncbi:hypothetical protein FXB41_17075 [Bradyrhizobium canariense]|nr:hypothetical protein [Bradyrhizobium canariense]
MRRKPRIWWRPALPSCSRGSSRRGSEIVPSWPGLSRPSTAFFSDSENVDARDKPGHDEF